MAVFRDVVLKHGWAGLLVASLVCSDVPVRAGPERADPFAGIVRIRATVPKEARTAAILGTERDGTGVVIDDAGHILTIGYLIIEAETIEVSGPTHGVGNAVFAGYDDTSGLALARMEPVPEVTPAILGRSADLQQDDPILVVSYGGPQAALMAKVVARRELAGYWEYLLEDAIFTAPPHARFGGAGLFGSNGSLLGVGALLTQAAIPGLGPVACNVFVPIDLVRPVLRDLIATGRPRKPARPWLGVYTWEVQGRLIVLGITPDGPAARAGLQPGDIILTVEGRQVTGLGDFYRNVWGVGDAGAKVTLGILHGMETRQVHVRSGDRYHFFGYPQPAHKEAPGLEFTMLRSHGAGPSARVCRP
jgi:S1-C subfamily serine protease